MRVPVKDTSYGDPKQFAADVIAAAEKWGLSHDAAILFAAHAAVSSGWGRKLKNYALVGQKGAKTCACPPFDRYPRDDWPDHPTDYKAPEGCDWGYDFTCLLTRERIDGQTVRVRHPFRAYGTLQEGVDAALKLLSGARYTSSLALLRAADEGYFRQLGRDGWYTASRDDVDASGRAAAAKIRSWERRQELPAAHVDGAGFVKLGLMVALAIAAVVWWTL